MEQVQQRFVKDDPELKGKVKIAVKDFPSRLNWLLTLHNTRERTSFPHLMEKWLSSNCQICRRKTAGKNVANNISYGLQVVEGKKLVCHTFAK